MSFRTFPSRAVMGWGVHLGIWCSRACRWNYRTRNCSRFFQKGSSLPNIRLQPERDHSILQSNYFVLQVQCVLSGAILPDLGHFSLQMDERLKHFKHYIRSYPGGRAYPSHRHSTGFCPIQVPGEDFPPLVEPVTNSSSSPYLSRRKSASSLGVSAACQQQRRWPACRNRWRWAWRRR